jgi:hypothetical protein
MKHLFRLLAVAGAVLLVWWAWTVFFPSPRTAIRHRLTQLAKLASFSPNEGDLTRLMNVEKIGGFFSEQVEVKIEVPGYPTVVFNSRDELKQAALGARSTIRGMKAEFPDMQIEVTPGNQAAIVDLTLMADVGDEKNAVLQELKFNMKKVDGQWVITHVETVKTLK